MHTNFWSEILKGSDHFMRTRHRWEDNIKMDLRQYVVRVWAGFV
jgi:hypothetical protein